MNILDRTVEKYFIWKKIFFYYVITYLFKYNHDKWDIRHMQRAKEISGYSKDPKKGVGATCARGKFEIISGYNGFPPGMPDKHKYLHNKEFKLDHVIHAEISLIAKAAREGISLKDSTLYIWPLPPCKECAKVIVSSGIKEVVISQKQCSQKWIDSFKVSQEIFKQAYVPIRVIKGEVE